MTYRCNAHQGTSKVQYHVSIRCKMPDTRSKDVPDFVQLFNVQPTKRWRRRPCLECEVQRIPGNCVLAGSALSLGTSVALLTTTTGSTEYRTSSSSLSPFRDRQKRCEYTYEVLVVVNIPISYRSIGRCDLVVGWWTWQRKKVRCACVQEDDETSDIWCPCVILRRSTRSIIFHDGHDLCSGDILLPVESLARRGRTFITSANVKCQMSNIYVCQDCVFLTDIMQGI